MILRSRVIAVLYIYVGLSDCFSLEPVDFVDFQDFDGVRSYPVLKVSFYPKNAKKSAKIKGDSRPSKFAKAESSEYVDNVREFQPMSREDIKKMKKLSFHGRSSPNEINIATGRNFSDARISPGYSPANQIDQRHRKYKHQNLSVDRKPSGSRKVTSKRFLADKGFLPLMRPSPINVHPADPPSFHTTRKYVDYLKARQKQFFSDLDDEGKSSPTQKLPDEVDYFVKREKELAEEQRPKLEHRQVEKDSVEIINRNDNPDYNDDNGDDDDDDDKAEEESSRYEHFVPFRLYAQVRHQEAENHKPRSDAPSPQAKEKLTLEKKNVYYKEEGYAEKDYDHGAEKVESHYRAKRNTADPKSFPVAMALIKKSELPQLNGEKLLKHIDELLKNSSFLLPDEDDVETQASDNIYKSSRKKFKSNKYPYYNLPDSTTLSTMSAFRYSENLKNFPKQKESLYKYKNAHLCEEINDDVDPVPDDIEEEGKRTKFNNSPKRLRNLGDKITCYKNKYFGKDPFDNPLFKEEYVAASIPIPLKESSVIAHQANPLITVYDDVIQNIRAAYVDELRQQKEDEITRTTQTVPTTKNISKVTTPGGIKVINLKSGARLPLFDINNFYPKLIIPPNDEPSAVKSNYEVEFVEIPVLDNYRTLPKPSNVIANLRPPSLPEKRRRRNPAPSKKLIQFSHPLQYFKAPTATPDRTKFKLL